MSPNEISAVRPAERGELTARLVKPDSLPKVLERGPSSSQVPGNQTILGKRAPIAILGVALDNVSTVETIELIEQMVASGRPHYLVTANVDFLVQAQEDVELRRILFDAHLVLCDGMPLVWASKLLGNPLPERVAGADLVPLLIEVAERKEYRLFFLGATEACAEHAVKNLKERYPKLIIAGHYSPPFSKLLEMDHEEIRRRIVAAKPDLLFVCFGCPKQEKWMAMHYRTLGVPVAIGVGATMDFLAGEVRRAPVWMRRIGAEWIFRLAQEPRRLFKRYVKDLWVFGWKIAAQSWQLRWQRPQREQDSTTSITRQESWQSVRLAGRLDLAMVASQAALAEEIGGDSRDCMLEADQITFIDSTGVGFLIRLQKQLRENGCHLVLIAPSKAVTRALQLMGLQEFFATAPDIETARRLIISRSHEHDAAVTPSGLCTSTLLTWHGEITAANAEEVWRQTQAHFEKCSGVSEWLIDLSDVRFMDSSGLGVMVRAKKLAQRQGAKLVFEGMQPAVRNVVQLARLDEFLISSSASAIGLAPLAASKLA